MRLSDYQRRAIRTDHTGSQRDDATLLAILGIAGEAGTLATAIKKFRREGPAYKLYAANVAEELGDLLWYVATLASKFDLNLDRVASRNLAKTRSRWTSGTRDGRIVKPLDSRFPVKERIPRRFTIKFQEIQIQKRMTLQITRNGKRCGDRLTDNSYFEDGYRFHDVFHLAYAAVLGWSPVTRKLLGCKRRSRRKVDEIEDGGRATVIEEGIAAFVFDYARRHSMLEGTTQIDFDVLKVAKNLTEHLEVFEASWRDWEEAILTGFQVFRMISRARGGYVTADLDNRRLEFRRL